MDLLALLETVALSPLAVLAWVYGGFVVLVLGLLALDLGVFHRRDHVFSLRQAGFWTAIWIGAGLLFNVVVYFAYDGQWFGLGLQVPQLGAPMRDVGGWEAARLYLVGYVIEKSLSVDNIFVIALVFSSLGIKSRFQHRVLFWGILGALILRGLMIGLGVTLIQRFAWITYVFGGLLVISAWRIARAGLSHEDPTRSTVFRLARKWIPLTDRVESSSFFTRIDGRLFGTPLLLALIVVEFSDVVFAVDSIPAIFAITLDPFLVFTSNVFAILGLRSLYFVLAGSMHRFPYLRWSLVAVLFFVGVKMLLVHTPLKIPTGISLGVVLFLLLAGILLSWRVRSQPSA